MPPATTISKGELINNIFSKVRIPKQKKLVVTCDEIACIPQREVIELYLYLCGVKEWKWQDTEGRIGHSNSFLKNLILLTQSFIAWPFQVFKQQWIANKLLRKDYKPSRLQKAPSKVVYIRSDHWFNLKSGGSVGHVSGVVNALQELNYDLQVVATSPQVEINENTAVEVLLPKYNHLRNIPELSDLAYNQQLYPYLAEAIKKDRPDFIYQRYSLGNYTGILLKQEFDIPLVCEYNGSLIWVASKWGGGRLIHKRVLSKIERLNLLHADLIVVVSEVLKQELVRDGIDSNKVLVNPNGVDPKKYNSSISGRSVSVKYQLENKITLGFIGTFAQWHGVVEMAKAIVLFFDTYPEHIKDVRFLLIGDGKLLPEVKSIISNSPYEETVIFTGRIPQEESATHLAACDMFLSPHIPNPDGTPFFGSPTKLFEYMAMEKPIIASDLDQIGDLLSHLDTAYMVEPANIQALANGIYDLINQDELRAKLAKNAKELVLSEYTWIKHVEKIIQALK